MSRPATNPSLTKLLLYKNISSVRAESRGDNVIIEPMVKIPANEVWLYKNKKAMKKVQVGLSQQGTVRRGSFAKYVD